MKRERGFGFLHVILALIFCVVALGLWSQHNKKMAAQEAEEKRQIEAQAAELQRQAQERQRKIAEEREALVKRQEDEKRKGDLEKAIASLKLIHGRWQDAERLAQSTARIALAQPVSTLQQIKRETDGILVPPCLDAAKSHLISGMNWTIEGFIQFMTDKKFSEITTPPFFSSAKKEFSEYEKTKDACQ